MSQMAILVPSNLLACQKDSLHLLSLQILAIHLHWLDLLTHSKRSRPAIARCHIGEIVTRAPLQIRIARQQSLFLPTVELKLKLTLDHNAAVQAHRAVHRRHGPGLQRHQPYGCPARRNDARQALDVLVVLSKVSVGSQLGRELARDVDRGDGSKGRVYGRCFGGIGGGEDVGVVYRDVPSGWRTGNGSRRRHGSCYGANRQIRKQTRSGGV
jgi:hypothetical protein